MPEIGITTHDELRPEELDPHFFEPNFIRPVPTAEYDPDFDDELSADYDISKDAIYMVPGMLPEPYWDLNMVQEQFNYAQMKKYLNRACKTVLKPHEAK